MKGLTVAVSLLAFASAHIALAQSGSVAPMYSASGAPAISVSAGGGGYVVIYADGSRFTSTMNAASAMLLKDWIERRKLKPGT